MVAYTIIFSDNRQQFFLTMVPDFFRIVNDFFSMTSKQREDAENDKFSRFKLFFIRNMLIIGNKKEKCRCFTFSTKELNPEIIS